jgi:hypothetical protein
LIGTWYKPYSSGLNEVEYQFSPIGNFYIKDVAYTLSIYPSLSLSMKSGQYEATDSTIIVHFTNGDVLFNYYFTTSDSKYICIYNNKIHHNLRKDAY